MAETDALGVVFPFTGHRRSTTALGREVLVDALREVDPVGARLAAAETIWRTGYPAHFRRLVVAGLDNGQASRTIATHGLASIGERLSWAALGGAETSLAEAIAARPGPAPAAPARELVTETVRGDGIPDHRVTIPYRGARLEGDALLRQLEDWTTRGIIEPSCAAAVAEVAAHPEWLDLSDVHLVVLGAGAEMGPLRAALRWGADVYAVDLARPQLWRGLLEDCKRYAGWLHLPARPGSGRLEERAGVDLVTEWPAVRQWLDGIDGRLVIGNYVYADGADNVRVAGAVDALTAALTTDRPDTALAFLATPTDVFAVPRSVVSRSAAAYEGAKLSRALRGPMRAVSGGRLLTRNYLPDADPGINDSIVPQQGPNYLLAKRIQRWRAAVERGHGRTVSFTVAPPTRTRSVVKNRALAAAYAGAHRFGIEVFEPATANTLLAVLLVHDLRTSPRTSGQVWVDEAEHAAHGGLWTTAYEPRSALGLAALLGLAAR